MEKKLKSCMDVLLRADLIYSARPSHLFWQNLADWLNWPCPVRAALQTTPVQDFDSFSIMFYYMIFPHIRKLETYIFCPVHISGLSHSVKGRGATSFEAMQ